MTGTRMSTVVDAFDPAESIGRRGEGPVGRDHRVMREPRHPRGRRPGAVAPQRIGVILVFLALVALNVWEGLHAPSSAGARIVGITSVTVWVLTLIGALGLGSTR
ncbi:MAG: hypothetical protein ABIV63_08520 [Caldimonas sp.]